MDKNELLFYNAYEEFYTMTNTSKAFQSYCKDAFGVDFSQDGFSNKEQIDMIVQFIPDKENIHILDIGCGNGKMLGYLQEKSGAYIHGFDYSKQAISSANLLFPEKSEFKEGIIGEIDYPHNYFDLITSMDTIYFAKDMTKFVEQIYHWLKSDGIFFVGYQEGDIIKKTENISTSELSKALIKNNFEFDAIDITKQTYELLKTKRKSAIAHKEEFKKENNNNWYEMLMYQTECVTKPYKVFKQKMSRYIFIARKK